MYLDDKLHRRYSRLIKENLITEIQLPIFHQYVNVNRDILNSLLIRRYTYTHLYVHADIMSTYIYFMYAYMFL